MILSKIRRKATNHLQKIQIQITETPLEIGVAFRRIIGISTANPSYSGLDLNSNKLPAVHLYILLTINHPKSALII